MRAAIFALLSPPRLEQASLRAEITSGVSGLSSGSNAASSILKTAAALAGTRGGASGHVASAEQALAGPLTIRRVVSCGISARLTPGG